MSLFKRSTGLNLVPFALGAMGALAFVFVGCERVPETPKPAESSPAAYMKDPVFRQALVETRGARTDLAKARNVVVEKMTALIEAKKRELKTEDLAKVKAELEKDPEWNSLYQRCLDVNQAINENLGKARAIVRERLTRSAKEEESRISK